MLDFKCMVVKTKFLICFQESLSDKKMSVVSSAYKVRQGICSSELHIENKFLIHLYIFQSEYTW